MLEIVHSQRTVKINPKTTNIMQENKSEKKNFCSKTLIRSLSFMPKFQFALAIKEEPNFQVNFWMTGFSFQQYQ